MPTSCRRISSYSCGSKRSPPTTTIGGCRPELPVGVVSQASSGKHMAWCGLTQGDAETAGQGKVETTRDANHIPGTSHQRYLWYYAWDTRTYSRHEEKPCRKLYQRIISPKCTSQTILTPSGTMCCGRRRPCR